MKQKPIRCPYCGSTAILKDASYVYGSKSKGGKVYVCSRYPECNSYVGVHPGTNIAKGTLADKQLRFKRIQAHQTFDQIWKNHMPELLIPITIKSIAMPGTPLHKVFLPAFCGH